MNEELRALILRFARVVLGDRNAGARPRREARYLGVELLARDRRDEDGGVWAFQHFGDGESVALSLEVPEALPVARRILVAESVEELHVPIAQGEVPTEVWSREELVRALEEKTGTRWLGADERTACRAKYLEQLEQGLARHRAATLPGTGPQVPWMEGCVAPRLQHLPPPYRPVFNRPKPRPTTRSVVKVRDAPTAGLLAWMEPPGGTTASVLLVQGPPGSGKSTALRASAQELAEQARADVNAPLPLLLDAESLQQQAFEELLSSKVAAEGFPGDPSSDWVVLVDGIQSVTEALIAALAALERHPQVQQLVVAARVEAAQALTKPTIRHLEVSPWGPLERDALLARWRHHLGEEVPLPDPVLASMDLPTSPLVLSCLLGLASEGAPFETLEDGFVSLTSELGACFEGIDTVEFEELALTGGGRRRLTRPAESIAAKLVALLASPEAPRISGWARWLTARALLRRTNAAFLRYARRARMVEGAALALLLLMREDPERAGRLLAQLGTRDTRTYPQACLDELHTLRIRTLVARCSLHLPRAAAELIANDLLFFAASERTRWWRQVVRSEVEALAAVGSSVWKALWAKLVPPLTATGSRVTWFEAHAPDRAETWLALLEEDDITARALAVTRLAPWVEREEARAALLSTLLDAGFEPLAGEPPAVRAAALIRPLERDLLPLDFLRAIVASGEQICAGAAAIALRPGEAPPERLLGALRTLWMTCSSPTVARAIQALATEETGRAWLEANWPEGLEKAASAQALPKRALESAEGAVPPLSERTREDLLRAIAPALDRPEVWTLIEQWQPSLALLSGVCRYVDKNPRALEVLLAEEQPVWLRASVQRQLGQALERRPELGALLVEAWPRWPERLRSSFPGLALEPLAARGDFAASAVYAQWLEVTPFIGPFLPVHPIPRDALAQVPIREAAIARAWQVWRYATVGQPDDKGLHRFLAPSSMGRALRCLWPAWSAETEIVDGLLDQVLGGKAEWREAARFAFSGGPRPLSLMELQRRKGLSQPQPSGSPEEQAEAVIKAVEEQGLLVAIEAVWAARELLRQGLETDTRRRLLGVFSELAEVGRAWVRIRQSMDTVRAADLALELLYEFDVSR